MKRYIAALVAMVMLCMCTFAYADVTVENDQISAYMDSTGGVVLTGYDERINATDAYELICIDAGRVTYMVENEDGSMDILHADFATSTERMLMADVKIACGYDGAGIYYVPASDPGDVYYVTFSGKKTQIYSSEEEVEYLQRSHHGLIIGFDRNAGAMLYDDTFKVVSAFNGIIGTERRILTDSADLVLTFGGELYIDDSTAGFPSMISSGVMQFECIDGYVYYIIETMEGRSLMQYSPATLSWQNVAMPQGKRPVSITTSYTQALAMDDTGVVYTINNVNCALTPFATITVPQGTDIENVFLEGVSGQLNVYSEDPAEEEFVLAFNFSISDSDDTTDTASNDDRRGTITLLATCELETEMTTFDVLTPAKLYETLRYGSRGDTVKDLQRMLVKLGYLNDSVDGIYGPRTRYAVMLFQDYNGLTVTGVADKQTQELLFESGAMYDPYRQIAYGARGLRVTEMQERLRYLGYMADPADGIYGPYTRAGVKLFQRENGLNPTGIADSRTLSRLYDVVAPRCSSYFEMNYGDSGWRVEQMNKRLKELYFLEGTPGSYYGSDTKAAVKRFQRDNGLSQTGVASAYMQELLFSDRANEYSGYITLRRGDESNRVYQLQRRLKELGYYKGNCTGYFGKYTYACLRDFQDVAGLEVTGIADIETQELLFSRYAPRKPEIGVISKPTIWVTGYIREINDNKYMVDRGTVGITWWADGDVDVYFYEITDYRGRIISSGYTYKNSVNLNTEFIASGAFYRITVYAIPENGSMEHAKSAYVEIVMTQFVTPEPEATPVPTPEPLVTIEPTPTPEATAEPIPEAAVPVISVSGDYTLEGNNHIIGDGGAIFSWTEEDEFAYDVVVTDEFGNIVFTPSLVSGGSVEVSRMDLEAEKQYYLVVTAYHETLTKEDGKSVRVMLMAGAEQPDPTEEPEIAVVELIVSVTGADKVSEVWQIGDTPITVSWEVIGEVTDFNIELIDTNGFGISSIMNTTQTSIQLSSDYVEADKVYGLRITANAGEASVDETIYVTLKPVPVEEPEAEEPEVEEPEAEEPEVEEPEAEEPEVEEPEAEEPEAEEPEVEEPEAEEPEAEEPVTGETEEEAEEEAADYEDEQPAVVEVSVGNADYFDGIYLIDADIPAEITWSNTGDATEYSLIMCDDAGTLLQQVDRTPYTFMTLSSQAMEDGRTYTITFVAHTTGGDVESSVAFARKTADAEEAADNTGDDYEENAPAEISKPVISCLSPNYDGVYYVSQEGMSLSWHAEGDILGYDLSLYDGDGNLFETIEGITDEEVYLSYDKMPEGEVFRLTITAVPADGDRSRGKSEDVYFTRAEAEEEYTEDEPAEEQPEEEHEEEAVEETVLTASAPEIVVEGYTSFGDTVDYIFDAQLNIAWSCEGDLDHYNVYLYDEPGNLVNSAMNVTSEKLTISADSLKAGEAYYLYIESIPVGGTDAEGEYSWISFSAAADSEEETYEEEYVEEETYEEEYVEEEDTEEAEEPVYEEPEVYYVSAPYIYVEGYSYKDDHSNYVFDEIITISWSCEGDLDHYNVYLFDDGDELANSAMGISYETLNISADSLEAGRVYYVYVEAVPVDGDDGYGEYAVIALMREAVYEPEEEEYTEEEYYEEEYYEEEYDEEEYYEEEYYEEESPEEEYYEEEYYEEPSYQEELVWDRDLDMFSDTEYIIAYQNRLAEWGWLIVVPKGGEYNGASDLPVCTEGEFDYGTVEATYNLQVYINQLAENGEPLPTVKLIDYEADVPRVDIDLLDLIMSGDYDVRIINPNAY